MGIFLIHSAASPHKTVMYTPTLEKLYAKKPAMRQPNRLASKPVFAPDQNATNPHAVR